MRNVCKIVFAVCLCLTGPTASAGAVGAELPAWTLKDAHGTPQKLGLTVRRIYANADRKGDALMKEAMAKLDQAALDSQGAVVIADISAAPFFVKSIIRSSLKDRRYRTWLDTSGETQQLLAYRPDQVTIIELENLRVKAIRHVGDAVSLRRELAPSFAEEPR